MSETKKVFRSRGKGKAGEREVAKMLEAWWCTMVEPCKFKSTPQSGGFGGAQAADVRGDFKIAGDLMTTAKQWRFTVEVKRREQGTLKNLYALKPSPVWGWWRQCVKAAVEEGRVPLLFFRRNNGEWFVMMPVEAFSCVPRLEAWRLVPVEMSGGVSPLLTTWEVLRDCVDIKAIIGSCHAYVSQIPKATSSQPSQTSELERLGALLATPLPPARNRRAPSSKSGVSLPTRPTERSRVRRTSSEVTGSSAAAPSSAPRAGRRAAARSPID